MLRPRDIKNKKFKTSFGGYQKDDVEGFFKDVYVDFQELYVENLKLREEIDDLNNILSDYKAREEALTEATEMARKVMDATNKCVRKKYDDAQDGVRALLDEAQKKAEKITEAAYEDATAIVKKAEKDALEKADTILANAKEEAEIINEDNEILIRKYNRMKKRIMLLIDAEANIIKQGDAYVFNAEKK